MRPVALVLLALLPVPGFALQPPDPPKPASIDELIVKIADLRAKQIELQKAEAATATELRAKLKELQDRLDKLGLNGPVPKPPEPPPPKPPEPKPADPLREKVAAAFEKSAGTVDQKAEWAKDLAALYRAAAKLAGDPAIATATALKAKLSVASGTLIGPDALKEVRQAVAGELAAVLPTTEADLTDGQRKSAADLFRRLAEILDGI